MQLCKKDTDINTDDDANKTNVSSCVSLHRVLQHNSFLLHKNSKYKSSQKI